MPFKICRLVPGAQDLLPRPLRFGSFGGLLFKELSGAPQVAIVFAVELWHHLRVTHKARQGTPPAGVPKKPAPLGG